MDDYKDPIAACCKQLSLSVNLVENAMIQTGESHQEYLYHLLKEEIRYRRETSQADQYGRFSPAAQLYLL